MKQPVKDLPLGIKAAGAFLMLIGGVSLGSMVIAFILTVTRSSSVSAGPIVPYTFRLALAAIMAHSGLALLRGRSWSRRYALGVLFVVGLLLVQRAVLMWAGGRPDFPSIFIGLLLAATVLMFVLLLRRSAAEALP
jgi:hypothetical protein